MMSFQYILLFLFWSQWVKSYLTENHRNVIGKQNLKERFSNSSCCRVKWSLVKLLKKHEKTYGAQKPWNTSQKSQAWNTAAFGQISSRYFSDTIDGNSLKEAMAQVDCFGCAIIYLPLNLSFNARYVQKLNLSRTGLKLIQSNVFENYTSLEVLDLSLNNIFEFRNECFDGLHQLKELILRDNNIHTHFRIWIGEKLTVIHNPATMFHPMKKLQYLDISNSNFKMNDIKQVLNGLSKGIKTLILNNIFRFSLTSSAWILDGNFTKSLNHTAVKYLKLEHNSIIVIKPGTLCNLRHVEVLSFAGNMLLGDRLILIDAVICLTKLHEIDIGGIQNTRRKRVSDTNLQLQPDVDHFSIIISVLKNLRVIKADHISGNEYGIHFNSHSVCWKNNLLKIDLSFTSIQYLNETILCMEHLEYLNLEGINSLWIDSNFFQSMVNLKVLILSQSSHTDTFQNKSAQNLFINNKKLKYLDISSNNLSHLPYNILKSNNQLEHLILRHNHFQQLSFQTTHLDHLKTLDLSFNNFQLFNETLIENLGKTSNKTNLTLVLQGTTLYCGCGIVPFIEKMKSFSINIANSSSVHFGPSCFLENGSVMSFHAASEHLLTSCRQGLGLTFMIANVFYVLGLMSISISASIYR